MRSDVNLASAELLMTFESTFNSKSSKATVAKELMTITCSNVTEQPPRVFNPGVMVFEKKQVNVYWIIIYADVHWMASFIDVIKISEKIYRDVEAFVELGNSDRND